MRWAPTLRIASRTAFDLCEPRLSMITRVQRRHQNALDVDQESFTVERPIQKEWCGDAVMAQRRQKRLRSPAPMRHLIVEPCSAQAPHRQIHHASRLWYCR